MIVGGGIYGACLAWEAALRGLSVALVEKGDFASGATSNSLKIIHGGWRSLQHGDIQQMRDYRRDSAALLRIAPHLVHPIAVVIPAYSRAAHNKAAATLRLHHLLPFDRPSDPRKQARMISAGEVQEHFPGIEARGLQGGALFYDAQVYSPERLTLAFVQSAAHIGADVVNYAQVLGFIERDGVITGIEVCDRLTDEVIEIHARLVIIAAGAWANRVQRLSKSLPQTGTPRLAKGVNIIVRQPYQRDAILAMSYREEASQLYFVSPWREYTIIGTAYSPYDKEPDRPSSTSDEINRLLSVINQAYPAANLTPQHVTYVHCGLLPMQGVGGAVRLLNRARITDHRRQGVSGLLSVEGVTFTNARSVAEAVINQAFGLWGKQPPRSISARTPLDGGQIEDFDGYLKGELAAHRGRLDDSQLRGLVYRYGSAYHKVLDYLDTNQPIINSYNLLRAQIRYSIYKEMAVRLSDVVFRRTELGSVEQPDPAVLQFCVSVMSEELRWSNSRAAEEIREVEEVFAWRAGLNHPA